MTTPNPSVPAPHPSGLQAYRAQLLYFRDTPKAEDEACEWIRDGLLVVRDGRIEQCGDHDQLIGCLPPGTPVKDWRGCLITPGFIDTHIHYPQTDMIASPAPGLLPWLETYTFPTERRFENPEYAQDVARFFLDELLRCGTTTALVYCTVHPGSAQAFFEESHARNLRMVAGKVMMDRNCPEYLRDTAESGARDSEDLIQRWHGTGRQLYALTPRFAPTSTPEQLGLCGELARRYQDVFIQSHVSENRDEV
ncbi:MAG: guanine deaminase, partial [Castellaniella sp.]|uniref:guanine deaminase n=1 Tax=Castellaniella sp. TaxID=1955812 RepID=UPI002A370F87